MRAIRAELPDDGIYVEDLTQVGYVGRMAFPVYHPRTYIHSGYQGTLGFGFATALGAKVGRPDRPVVSVSGDGGFMYNVQELSTAARHGIDIVAIVFADGAFGNVRRMQKEDYGNRLIGVDLLNPQFPKMAESFGVAGVKTTTPRWLAPGTRRRPQTPRHDLDRGCRRRNARPVEGAGSAARPRPALAPMGAISRPTLPPPAGEGPLTARYYRVFSSCRIHSQWRRSSSSPRCRVCCVVESSPRNPTARS